MPRTAHYERLISAESFRLVVPCEFGGYFDVQCCRADLHNVYRDASSGDVFHCIAIAVHDGMFAFVGIAPSPSDICGRRVTLHLSFNIKMYLSLASALYNTCAARLAHILYDALTYARAYFDGRDVGHSNTSCAL